MQDVPSHYYLEDRIEENLSKDPLAHRRMIGGLWDVIGPMQKDYLCQHGLRPEMRLIDVGCGSLRGGIPLIQYLNPENYFGIDISKALLEAGYSIEITNAGLQDKVSREHLKVTDDFDFAQFETKFDMGLAVSVFTHLPLDYLTRCLRNLSGVMRPGAKFFATFFLCPDAHAPEDALVHDLGGVTSHGSKDPYHFTYSAIDTATKNTGWALDDIVSWDHPRNQKMAAFSLM